MKQDLVYFGTDWERGSVSQKLQSEFMEDVKNIFPEADFVDAYDEIKGYRQEVHIPEESWDDYLAWAFADGWDLCSLTLCLIRLEDEEGFSRLCEKAKAMYPENFEQ
jgi:hypothetical protein